MADTTPMSAHRPDYPGLFALAASQHGMVAAAQARQYGFSRDSLSRLATQGTLRRLARGVYRWRDFPGSPFEDIAEAWLRLGESAIASHETALVLNGLTDLMPRKHHFVVPRSARGRRRIPTVTLHTRTHPISPDDVQRVHGIPAMRPEIAIIEAAAEGADPTQVDLALRELHERGTLRADAFRQWLSTEPISRYLKVQLTSALDTLLKARR